jgi:hypothetical protein
MLLSEVLPLHQHKVKKLPTFPEFKPRAQNSEINTAAAQPAPETPASFIEIISKRIDKLLEKAPRKSSAA